METVQEILDRAEKDVFELVICSLEGSRSQKEAAEFIDVTTSWISRYLDQHAERVIAVKNLPYWVECRYRKKGIFQPA
jgi:DNA-directed RNA polymerase specialized sigma subunit